jgi:iron(III) transport system ATP-binding protein
MTITRSGSSRGVTVERLSITYDQVEVLKGVDLQIEAGEFFTFLGPSGSGKSTLLRAIAGFGPPPQGRILIGNDDVTRLPPWQRNVGMVFQSYALWPHMTVRKNVAFGLEERKVPTEEIRSRVEAALDLVGLLALAERRPSQLSGGQQQRVALARTIVVQPRVLLLDEPLSNLDANLRVQMRRELLELQRELELTTIFVTHDQEEANTISDRIAVLNDGNIQQVGSPMELYDNPVNRFVAGFLGTANFISGRVEAEDDSVLLRAGADIVIPLSEAAGGEGAVTAIFRPQNLSIRNSGDPGRKGPDLRGRIQHLEFLGSVIRYSVQVGDHVILVDDSHQVGQPTYAPGDEVLLGLDLAQVRVLSS